MKNEDMPDRLILNYKYLKIVFFEETRQLFKNHPYVLEQWQKDAYSMTGDVL